MSNTTSIDDGGQAFPRPASTLGDWTDAGALGMTLRDWFAGQALSGLIGSGATIRGNRNVTAFDYAPLAYEFADTMLAARKAQP